VHEEAALQDADRGSNGGWRRHRRRNRRHSSRSGRPAPPHEHKGGRRKTEGSAAAPAPLVMPWEGDPFWQVCAWSVFLCLRCSDWYSRHDPANIYVIF
jgi:hypothetical protein